LLNFREIFGAIGLKSRYMGCRGRRLSFFSELRRRNVFKAGVGYLIMAWLLIQVADIVLPTLGAPGWVPRTITFVLILGLPVAVVLAWAYEVTPQGIKKTRNVPLEESIARITGQKFNYAIIAALVVALIVVILDDYGPSDADPLDGVVDVSQPVPGFSNRAAIAVLPFLNLSDDPEQEYFADGITEDLITALQSFQSFPIIARTSTFTYKNNSQTLEK